MATLQQTDLAERACYPRLMNVSVASNGNKSTESPDPLIEMYLLASR
jgi:hypothetical protein